MMVDFYIVRDAVLDAASEDGEILSELFDDMETAIIADLLAEKQRARVQQGIDAPLPQRPHDNLTDVRLERGECV